MLVAALAACAGCAGPGSGTAPTTLQPYTNPFGPADARWEPQPERAHPLQVAVDGRGHAWVTLHGNADEPGDAVARVHKRSGEVTRLPGIGSSPTGLAMHPDGRWLVVFTRYTDRAAVVDTQTLTVVGHVPTDFYNIDGAFSEDGTELWVTNRQHGTVAVWSVETLRGGLWLTPVDTIEVGHNPRNLALSERWVVVGSAQGTWVSVIDREQRTEVSRLDVGAPTNDVALLGDLLWVATLSASTQHPADVGRDTDGDGLPGDGTPNTNFSDLQNELAAYRLPEGEPLHRYTSDTVCCPESKDVAPEDAEGGLLAPRDTWLVQGALPEQLVVGLNGDEPSLWVGYSASNQVQRFEVDAQTGALTPRALFDTDGYAPHGLALDGDALWVAHRLSDSVGRYDASDGTLLRTASVGGPHAQEFPATQAEVGELFFFVTAPFTVDGDQSCSHCHRQHSHVDKAIALPFARYPEDSLRMTQSTAGAYDTRPWLWEASGDEFTFRPVNLPEPSLPGVASIHPSAHSPELVLTDRLRRMVEGEPDEDDDPFAAPTEEVLAEALITYLFSETNLLPSPYPLDAAADRGRALFERADVGCAPCHPAPTFTVSHMNNPFGVPPRMGPVVSPLRNEAGDNVDLLDQHFGEMFPETEQDRCEDVCPETMCANDETACDHLRELRIGAPSLRGLWHRPPSMLHHGLAQGLREVLATPGHPALQAGETGFNERDGIPDTHGGTSHLSADQLDDLIAYLRTL
jgi:sugar lactone lactonase YvrE